MSSLSEGGSEQAVERRETSRREGLSTLLEVEPVTEPPPHASHAPLQHVFAENDPLIGPGNMESMSRYDMLYGGNSGMGRMIFG
mmetsp:Transcript_23919/g.44171  ORF Transcript_23919/g.44171 Transcript_23919/m.44171 type:complete len:84 (-) Transcript_23919:81-332(-)